MRLLRLPSKVGAASWVVEKRQAQPELANDRPPCQRLSICWLHDATHVSRALLTHEPSPTTPLLSCTAGMAKAAAPARPLGGGGVGGGMAGMMMGAFRVAGLRRVKR